VSYTPTMPLRDPTPEQLRRRLIVPLSRFNDNDICSMDYSSWKATEYWYDTDAKERAKVQRLMASIELHGLRERVEIRYDGGPIMANGHHRIVALRRLGWTHVPYRWYVPDRRWDDSRPNYVRAMLPPPVIPSGGGVTP